MLKLVFREMMFSRWNTLAGILVITAATGLFVAMSDLGAASVDTTRILMKEMGFNLQITPSGTDPARLQALDYEGPDMPESHVQLLASQAGVMAQHFVGKLQKKMVIQGNTAVITGVLGQTTRVGTSKDPMPTSYVVPRGEVFLGAAIARSLDARAGESLEIEGKSFIVSRVLAEYGAIPEDIRIFAHLKDVQDLLQRPGRINGIDALACQCPANVEDIVGLVRKSILAVLPDVQVQPYYSLLLARHRQRVLAQRLQFAVLAGALLSAAAAIWGLAYQNVYARRHEIGVLRALGFSELRVMALFLGKTAFCALIAGMFGCMLGRIFSLQAHIGMGEMVVAPMGRLLLLVPATVVAALLSSLPPVFGALLRDPADILGETLP